MGWRNAAKLGGEGCDTEIIISSKAVIIIIIIELLILSANGVEG